MHGVLSFDKGPKQVTINISGAGDFWHRYNDAGKQTSSNKAVWDQHEMTQQLTATSSLILKTVRGSVLRTRCLPQEAA